MRGDVCRDPVAVIRHRFLADDTVLSARVKPRFLRQGETPNSPHPSWRQADAFSLHSFGVNPPVQALHYAETEGLCRSSITLITNSYPVSTPP